MCNTTVKSSFEKFITIVFYLFVGLSCVFLLSGCRRKIPESQLDSNGEQIQNLSQQAEEAALQAERYQDQAESELAAIKEIASQVITQKSIAGEDSTLQLAKTAADASIKAAQSAGEQAEITVQCSEEIEDMGTDSSISEKTHLAVQDFQNRAQTSFDDAKKSSEMAQSYLELISRASKDIPESRKSIESARKAISDGEPNAQSRQRIEAAIEKLEDINDILGDSISCRSPEEIGQMLDQMETASVSLNEQLKALDNINDAGMEPVLLPKIGSDEGLSAGRRKQAPVGVIPSLPVSPKIVRNPIGGFELPDLPEEPIKESTGKWTQIEGGSGADFLPGNYSTSEFDFKVNGVLEVKRTFGINNEIILMWRVGYEFNDKKNALILGKNPKKKPLPSSLTGFSMAESNISAQAANISFPATIDFVQIDENRIKIGSKVYRR